MIHELEEAAEPGPARILRGTRLFRRFFLSWFSILCISPKSLEREQPITVDYTHLLYPRRGDSILIMSSEFLFLVVESWVPDFRQFLSYKNRSVSVVPDFRQFLYWQGQVSLQVVPWLQKQAVSVVLDFRQFLDWHAQVSLGSFQAVLWLTWTCQSGFLTSEISLVSQS